jgi:hypothetical protein
MRSSRLSSAEVLVAHGLDALLRQRALDEALDRLAYECGDGVAAAHGERLERGAGVGVESGGHVGVVSHVRAP